MANDRSEDLSIAIGKHIRELLLGASAESIPSLTQEEIPFCDEKLSELLELVDDTISHWVVWQIDFDREVEPQ